MQQFSSNTEIVDSKVNLTEQLYRYLKNWKWFLLSAMLTLSIAYVYLRYQIPQYGLSTTILIKDDKKGTATELDAFSDLGILGVKKSNLENEIEMFRSRRLSQNSIKELKFNISYYAEGRILTPELYDECPIELVFENEKDATNGRGEFNFKYLKDNQFEISFYESTKSDVHTFNEFFDSPIGRVAIKPKSDKSNYGNSIIIKISPILSAAIQYKNKMSVKTVGERTS
ncbi:MAG: hypothetical protein CVU07_08320, partial [Bacteroidetes bacterium HGW-Bacteroidetes-23]